MPVYEFRSLLLLPANAPGAAGRVRGSGTDAVILDLEDSIAPGRKHAARQEAGANARALAAAGVPVVLRVNAGPADWRADLAGVDLADVRAVMLSKTESPEQVVALAQCLDALHPDVAIAALIESPLGVVRASEISRSSPRLRAFGFGAADYARAMAIVASPQNVGSAARYVAVAARSAGLAGWGLADDLANLTGDLRRFEGAACEARQLGFTGCMVIHPEQVAVLNRVFAPLAVADAAR